MLEVEVEAGIILSKADGSVSSSCPVWADMPLISGAVVEYRDRQCL